MRARTTAVVHPGGRLGALHCEPPLTLRRITAAKTGTCALCLVGTAAGPLAGDDVELHLAVKAGAHAELSATGASIAQGRILAGRTAQAAHVRFGATVDAGARLFADPGPLVVCEGARVDVDVVLELAGDATLEWHELVVLGRTHDAHPGAATLSWDVTRDGRPLLRQYLDLLDVEGWSGLTGGHRVLASALLAGPGVEARTVVQSSSAVTQRVDPHAMLLTVLGNSAAEVRRDLGRLRASVERLPV